MGILATITSIFKAFSMLPQLAEFIKDVTDNEAKDVPVKTGNAFYELGKATNKKDHQKALGKFQSRIRKS